MAWGRPAKAGHTGLRATVDAMALARLRLYLDRGQGLAYNGATLPEQIG